MEKLILNLDIRFPCPSMSVETGMAKLHTDNTTNSLEPDFLKKNANKVYVFDGR